jgi:hypothetical protein
VQPLIHSCSREGHTRGDGASATGLLKSQTAVAFEGQDTAPVAQTLCTRAGRMIKPPETVSD